MLETIDWSADSYSITEAATLDLSTDGTLDREELMKHVARTYEQDVSSSHFVYCIEYEDDGETCWYVGETENLHQRLTAHIMDKNVTNIERVEPQPDRDVAREREHDMHCEVVMDKESTNVYGGH